MEEKGRWRAPDGNWYFTDGPPAPGWWRGGDGNWHPPDEPSSARSLPRPARSLPTAEVEYSQFHVATIVAIVFKVAAVLTLVVGLYLFFYVPNHYPNDGWKEQAVIIGGSIFLSAALAFFAYVLDLLRALVFDSRRK
jgi:hypothetical protein